MTTEDMNFEIGQNIKSILDEYGMSQKELADEIGVSKQIISSYIYGERQPTIKNLINIAYILNCDINELITCDDFIE